MLRITKISQLRQTSRLIHSFNFRKYFLITKNLLIFLNLITSFQPLNQASKLPSNYSRSNRFRVHTHTELSVIFRKITCKNPSSANNSPKGLKYEHEVKRRGHSTPVSSRLTHKSKCAPSECERGEKKMHKQRRAFVTPALLARKSRGAFMHRAHLSKSRAGFVGRRPGRGPIDPSSHCCSGNVHNVPLFLEEARRVCSHLPKYHSAFCSFGFFDNSANLG